MSRTDRIRTQFGLRHLMLLVAAVAVTLGAVQQALRPGLRGDGARVFLLFALTTAAPLSFAVAARQGGRNPIWAGSVGALVTAPFVWLLMVVSLIVSGRWALTDSVVGLLASLLIGIAGLEYGWGLLIGLIVAMSGRQRSYSRPPIESKAHKQAQAAASSAMSATPRLEP